MDRRRFPRYPTNLEVTVIEFARPAASSSGIITDISEGGVRIQLEQYIAPGALIRLDLVDSMFWGHVVHARAEPGGYSMGIEVEKVLMGGSDISRLLQRVLEESSSTALEVLIGTQS